MTKTVHLLQRIETLLIIEVMVKINISNCDFDINIIKSANNGQTQCAGCTVTCGQLKPLFHQLPVVFKLVSFKISRTWALSSKPDHVSTSSAGNPCNQQCVINRGHCKMHSRTVAKSQITLITCQLLFSYKDTCFYPKKQAWTNY